MHGRRFDFLLLVGENMKNPLKKSYRVAFGGISAAIAIVLLMMTGIFPFADYALPAVAGVLSAAAVIELNPKSAWLMYAAVSIISLLVVPRKEPVMLYVFFFGYYPIIKSNLEKIKSHAVEWIIKFAIFNAAVVVCYFILMFLMSSSEMLAEFNEFGKYGIYLFWFAGNIIFLLYDIALTRLLSYYILIFREKFINRLK